MRMYTIGHSTRSLGELVSLLRENGVERLADIRRYPGSKRYPHFSSESLQRTLPEEGIEYRHMPELGGRRKPLPDSPNTIWRNEQFRAYADYMATDEFREAVDALLAPHPAFGHPLPAARGEGQRVTAIMCAEAVPWRCHRNLVADDLVRRAVDVRHILGPGSTKPHEMNPHARVEGDHLVYNRSAQQSLLKGPQ